MTAPWNFTYFFGWLSREASGTEMYPKGVQWTLFLRDLRCRTPSLAKKSQQSHIPHVLIYKIVTTTITFHPPPHHRTTAPPTKQHPCTMSLHQNFTVLLFSSVQPRNSDRRWSVFRVNTIDSEAKIASWHLALGTSLTLSFGKRASKSLDMLSGIFFHGGSVMGCHGLFRMSHSHYVSSPILYVLPVRCTGII